MTNAPDALDAILLAKARRRTGVCWDSWLRVDDVWSQAPQQTVSCRACGNTICDVHAPNVKDAIVAHKADHAIVGFPRLTGHRFMLLLGCPRTPRTPGVMRTRGNCGAVRYCTT